MNLTVRVSQNPMGGMREGLYLIRIVAENATQLKGKRHANGAQMLCAAAGLDWAKVQEYTWSYAKSGNLKYHPATYWVYVEAPSLDALR